MDGMMVNLNRIMGIDNWKAARDSIGKVITALSITEEMLSLTFADGSTIELFDNGQCCCENRWMHTDDDLPYYVGATFMDIAIADGPEKTEEWGGTEESQFLKVKTSKGEFTVKTYNAHNGYYGGFVLAARLKED